MEDLELCKLALKNIEADPAAHKQMYWITRTQCGTAACIAGHILLAAGYRYRLHEQGAGGDFLREDGSAIHDSDVASLAAEVSGFSREELGGFPYSLEPHLFMEMSNPLAVKRFRALIEAEEARRAAA